MTDTLSFLRTLDILANAMLIGVPVWVFFLQSPLLFKFMGRDKFLSPMMRLTKLMFRWTLPICAGISFIAYNVGSIQTISSGMALLSVLINAVLVVPRALEAGKRATRTADKTQSVSAFAVDGGHQSDTRALHQTVVVFVVIMLVASIAHVHFVVNGTISD